MAPVAGCGFRRRPKNRFCSIIQRAAASATSAPSGSATASSSFRRETDKFNGATFFAFLQALYRVSTREGLRRVVVITDNARHHHARLHRSWWQEHAARFVLDYLPTYSPDLNPIERVWKLTRRQCVHNRYFPLLDDSSLP
jgi:hypothetical protein